MYSKFDLVAHVRDSLHRYVWGYLEWQQCGGGREGVWVAVWKHHGSFFLVYTLRGLH